MAGFKGLTFTVYPVVTSAGVLNASIVAGAAGTGTAVAGILDPVAGINRMYDPASVGLVPTASDTPSTWLPTVSAISATSVNDQYWAAVPGSTQGANNKLGTISVSLTAAAKDTVRASSVMNFKLSTNAFVIAATAGTF